MTNVLTPESGLAVSGEQAIANAATLATIKFRRSIALLLFTCLIYTKLTRIHHKFQWILANNLSDQIAVALGRDKSQEGEAVNVIDGDLPA